MPGPCLGIVCASEGLAVQTSELVFDGTSFTTSTCGDKTACLQPEIVPSGHYIARMCATPGTISAGDAGSPTTCTASGPVECVDVPFYFPGPSPIEGKLP